MNNSWLYILGLMLGASFITTLTNSIVIAILADILVLVGAYFILRRDPFIDMKSSMLFLSILTVVNILVTLGIISTDVSREAMFALIIWSWFGSRSKLFLVFILGCCVYNAVQMLQLYQMIQYTSYAGNLGAIMNLLLTTSGGITVITTMLISMAALVMAAYINR